MSQLDDYNFNTPSLLESVINSKEAVQDIEDFVSGKTDLKREYLDYAGIRKEKNLGIEDRLDYDQTGTGRNSWSYATNGMPVRNGNKTHNNMSKFGLNQMGQDIANSGYQQDEQGRWFRNGQDALGFEVDENGNNVREYIKDSADRPSSMYYGETKNDPDTVKRGTSRKNAQARYTPQDGYGWESGPEGIDVANPNTREVFNDKAKIDAYEALVNANPNILRQREYFDDGSNMSAVQELMYGSGKSEYTNREGTAFLDDPNAIPEEERFLTDADKAQIQKMKETESDTEHTLIANEVQNSLDGYTKEGLDAINKEQWKADKEGWTGKRISQMNEEELADYQRMRNRDQLEQGYYADDGFLMGTAQKIGKQAYRAAAGLADTGGDVVGWGKEQAYKIMNGGELTKEQQKSVDKTKDFWNPGNGVVADEKTINRALRIDTMRSAAAHKEIGDEVDKGNYMGAIGKAIDNIDSLASDSIPEMMMIGNPALFAAAVNLRVQDQKQAFKKKNKGQEASELELALMYGTNAAVLLLEKIALFPKSGKLLSEPLRKAFASASAPMINKVLAVVPDAAINALVKTGTITKDIAMKAGNNRLTQALRSAGIKIGDVAHRVTPRASGTITGAIAVAGGVAGKLTKGAAFEGIQEPLDQTQENLWKKGGAGKTKGLEAVDKVWEMAKAGKIISKKDALTAAASGIGLGVIMGAPGNLATMPETIEKVRKDIRDATRVEDFENMTDAEKDTVVSTMETAIASDEIMLEGLQDMETRLETVDFEELLESENSEEKDIVANASADMDTDKKFLEKALTEEFLEGEGIEQENGTTTSTHEILMTELGAKGKAFVEELAQRLNIEYEKNDEGKITKLDTLKTNIVKSLISTKEGRKILIDDKLLLDSTLMKLRTKWLYENEKKANKQISEHAKILVELGQEQVDGRKEELKRIERIRRRTKNKSQGKRTNKRVPDVQDIDGIKAWEDKGKIEKVKEVLLNLVNKQSTSKAKVMKILNQYTDEAIENAIERSDPGTTMEVAGTKVLESRERARANSGIESTKVGSEEDYKMSAAKSKMAENFSKVKALAAREGMSKEEANKTLALIYKLESMGHLTEKQKDSLSRLTKQNVTETGDDVAYQGDGSEFVQTSAEIKKQIMKLKKKMNKYEKKIDEAITDGDKDTLAELEVRKMIANRERVELMKTVREVEAAEKENNTFEEVNEEELSAELDEEIEKEEAAEEQAKKDAEADVEEDTEEEIEEDTEPATEETEESSTENENNVEYKGYVVTVYNKDLGSGGYIEKNGIVVASTSDSAFNSVDMLKKIVDGMADGKTEAEAKEAALGKSEPTSQGESVENLMNSIENGFSQALRERVVKQLKAGKEVKYTKKEAINAAKSSPDFKVKDNVDGSVTVTDVKDSDGKWVMDSTEETAEEAPLTQEDRDKLIKENQDRIDAQEYSSNAEIDSGETDELDDDWANEQPLTQEEIDDLTNCR